MISSRVIAVLVLLVAPIALRAQPTEPVAHKLSLDQLTDRAAAIVVSTVTSRKAEWEHYGGSRLIITKITLAVEQSIKGSTPRTLVVEVVGGTIGDETLTVSDVPAFRVGDRDVLFLNGHPHAVSPLVGSDQGRFRVLNESAGGTARVLSAGFTPLRSAAEVGATRAGPVTTLASALSLSEFVGIVRDRVRLQERR